MAANSAFYQHGCGTIGTMTKADFSTTDTKRFLNFSGTCVSPAGHFVYGIHHPRFGAANLRGNDYFSILGTTDEGRPHDNRVNFPAGDINEIDGGVVYEIPNPFPFRGATYILASWADQKADDPAAISLPPAPAVSFSTFLDQLPGMDHADIQTRFRLLEGLPPPLRLALAGSTADPEDLMQLARLACDMEWDETGNRLVGLKYRVRGNKPPSPVIHDHPLFEMVANNPHLPDSYKEVMVLRPGAQGGSEIVGEWQSDDGKSHVFEYLRQNSYIPWGHYAANMAHDAVRYRVRDLTPADMIGMRHLYYQRTFVRLAENLGITVEKRGNALSVESMEDLRLRIRERLASVASGRGFLPFTRTLWGWNFGFDYAPSGYRLHASHQQIHQQYALIPAEVASEEAVSGIDPADALMPSYACGDRIAEFTQGFRCHTGKPFFDAYIQAIHNNQRLDGQPMQHGQHGRQSLIIHADDNVMLFVPKAQTSQWEVQLMTKKPVGNIVEADAGTRASLDKAMLIAVRILEAMGARMITTIEYSKAFDNPDTDQRLLYAFLPRLPESPGAFSEAQLRWINGHYPEDFCAACRLRLAEAMSVFNHPF